MPAHHENNGVEQASGCVSSDASPFLSRSIQQHLGQKLRAAYYEVSDKPAYLGDPAIPPELDSHVRRLEQRERIHNKGVEAVERALGEILRHQDRLRPSAGKTV